MARARNPANENGRMRTEKWREGLQARGGWETFQVDTAIAGALSLYLREALIAESQKDLRRVDGLEYMAAVLLSAAKGKDDVPEDDHGAVDLETALKRVRGRLRRKDIESLFRIVNSKTKPEATGSRTSTPPITS